MASRALFCTILVLLLSTASAGQRRDDNFGMHTGSILGTVYRGASHPVVGAQIDVVDLTTHAFVAHTQTFGNGSFAIDSLPSGRYEVIITAGVDESRSQVEVTWAAESVTVHLPETPAVEGGGRDRVSVNQLQVPRKARDAFRKAQAALDRKDDAEAARLVEQALTLYPQYAQALALRAMLRLQAGHPDQALADLQEAVRCDPGDPASYLLLAVTDNWLGHFDDAIAAADRALALAPSAWMAYFETGVALEGKREFEHALLQLEKAQGLAPQDFALLHLAKAQAWKGLQNSEKEKSEMDAYRSRAAAESARSQPQPPATGNALMAPGTNK